MISHKYFIISQNANNWVKVMYEVSGGVQLARNDNLLEFCLVEKVIKHKHQRKEIVMRELAIEKGVNLRL